MIYFIQSRTNIYKSLAKALVSYFTPNVAILLMSVVMTPYSPGSALSMTTKYDVEPYFFTS